MPPSSCVARALSRRSALERDTPELTRRVEVTGGLIVADDDYPIRPEPMLVAVCKVVVTIHAGEVPLTENERLELLGGHCRAKMTKAGQGQQQAVPREGICVRRRDARQLDRFVERGDLRADAGIP